MTPRVFLSSTGRDLGDYRAAAIAVCNELGLIPVAMEFWESLGHGATAISLAKLNTCDVFVGFFAHRYGYVEDGDDRSVTEREFDHAAGKMDRLCFVMSADHPWPLGKVEVQQLVRQEAFKARVGNLAPLPFGTVEEFRHRVYLSLSGWLKRQPAPTTPTPPAPSGLTAKQPPPKPPVCFGRETPLAELRATLLPSSSDAKVPATPVVGVGGIGKSTVVLTVLWDEGVRARYEERRHFVRLDGAPSRSGVVAAMAEVLGLPLGDALEARLLDFLGRGGPHLLVLDNAETPLLAEDRTETEELLGHLAAIPSLTVVATLRGTYSGPGWRRPLELRRLDEEAAHQTFLAGTSGQFADDPGLAGLLRELEGWPLAVTLLSHQARYYADLKELTDAWRRKRAALLTKGVKQREADIGASIEMSLGCPLLTQDGRRLLSLLGILPDGVRREDLTELLPPDGADAAVVLRRVGGLAFYDGPRIRVLAPLREYLAANLPAQADDLARAVAFFCRLAEVEGNKVGKEGGADASVRLGAESGNLVAMVRQGLRAADAEPAFRGALGLGRFSRFSGVDLSAALVAAAQAARDSANVQRQGDCIQVLGDIARRRSRAAEARRYYEEARPLFQQAGDIRGEASCVGGLGDIAVDHSDHAEARRRYEEARPLCRKARDIHGEAHCIRGLADIALRRSDYAEARRRYEEARPLYRSADAVSGEATCIWRLGDIADRSADSTGAQRYYEEARQLFRSVGDLRGEARCILRLGDLALERSEQAEARRCYEQARPLFQPVGDVRDEANCIRGLGAVARDEGNLASARQLFEQALALYHRIEEPYSIGLTNQLLARITDVAERQQHVQSARDAWNRLDRPELVAELDREFGPPLADPDEVPVHDLGGVPRHD